MDAPAPTAPVPRPAAAAFMISIAPDRHPKNEVTLGDFIVKKKPKQSTASTSKNRYQPLMDLADLDALELASEPASLELTTNLGPFPTLRGGVRVLGKSCAEKVNEPVKGHLKKHPTHSVKSPLNDMRGKSGIFPGVMGGGGCNKGSPDLV